MCHDLVTLVLSGIAWFRNASFRYDVAFADVVFRGDSEFKNATFSDADFSCSSDIALARDTFDQPSLKNATFEGRAIFTNRKFTQPTDFSGGHFRVPPEFYGCALHQGTTFLGRKFLDTGKSNVDVDAVKAYGTLKLETESI